MEPADHCLLYEPEPYWASRLRGLLRISGAGERPFTQVRIASEIAQLLAEHSGRLVLVALRETMSARQCAARIRQASELTGRWPQCQVAFLLDEGLEPWQRPCWEMGTGLVFVGPASLPAIVRTMRRFLDQYQPTETPADEPDSLAWLPW